MEKIAEAAPDAGGGTEQTPARTATPGRARAHRQRNARGQGARLADDIVAGALALIERTGSEEAVTLRAVAREIGIAAPSIYAHFADREAIIMAVVLRVFDELSDAITRGQAASGPDPVDRLVAGCEAYLTFGLEHPARYGVLFVLHGANPEEYCAPVRLGANGSPVLAFGAEIVRAAGGGDRGMRHGRRVGQHGRGHRRDRRLGRAARDGHAAHRAPRLSLAGAARVRAAARPPAGPGE